MRLLIPHDFGFYKYYPPGQPLPYEATGRKLADAIAARDGSVDLLLPQDAAETAALLREAEALVTYSLNGADFARTGRLRWIQAASAGIDHFLRSSDPTLAEIAARGVVLTKASGVTRIVIGEHVFAMLLAMSRGVPRAVRQQERHHWDIFMGAELHGTTLAVIGLGGIGERVAELGRAFGMHVIGTRRSAAGYVGAAHEAFGADRVDEVLARADHVVLACSLNESTRGRIDARRRALMKPGAVLVNISRGEVVVEADLVAALTSGTIAGAALDTFGTPGRGDLRSLEELSPTSALWDLPNVLVMPNNASATPKIYDYLADIVVENHGRMSRGEPLLYRVEA
jgi:phosphoglycerate dehydrogenase-like enzyme